MKYLSRPDIQLYLIAILTFLVGTLIVFNSAQVIHTGDTWTIIEEMKTPLELGAFIGLEGFLYAITRRFRQLRWLQVLHVISMVFLPVIFFLYIQPSMPRRYVDYGDNQPDPSGKLFDVTMLIARLVFIIGQFAFIANLITGFRRGRKGPHHSESLGKPSSVAAIQILAIGSALLAAGILDELFGESLFLSAFRPAVAVSLLFIFEALIYALAADFRQWPVLQRIHVSCSLAAAVSAFLFYYSLSPAFANELSVVVLWLFLITFFAGQIAFIVNITAGFIRGRKSHLPN